MSDDLDLAIDRAVREMLDVEPSADLRAKVIARIEQPSALSSELSAFSWLRYGVPAAAAAALVLVLVVTLARRFEPTVQPRTVAQAADVRVPAEGGPSQQILSVATPVRTSATSQQTRLASAATVAPAPVAAAADSTTGVELLKTITPIEVAPIGHTSIAPEPIALRPLNPIAEVQIAPLNPPDRRD